MLTTMSLTTRNNFDPAGTTKINKAINICRPIPQMITVCEIFYWRDVTTCFTMTYGVKDFDVFVNFLKGKSWKTNELQKSRFWPKLA